MPHLKALISAGRAQEGPPPKLCPSDAMQSMSSLPLKLDEKSLGASGRLKPSAGEPEASDDRSLTAVLISSILCLHNELSISLTMQRESSKLFCAILV